MDLHWDWNPRPLTFGIKWRPPKLSSSAVMDVVSEVFTGTLAAYNNSDDTLYHCFIRTLGSYWLIGTVIHDDNMDFGVSELPSDQM